MSKSPNSPRHSEPKDKRKAREEEKDEKPKKYKEYMEEKREYDERRSDRKHERKDHSPPRRYERTRDKTPEREIRRDRREEHHHHHHRHERSTERDKYDDRMRRRQTDERVGSSEGMRKRRRDDEEEGGRGIRGRREEFVKREPPPGGWDKPSWEPSGTLKMKKEEPPEEEESMSKNKEKGKKEEEPEKPSFVPSGKLAKDTNTYKGVLIKYNEPPEAKMPKLRWRMYPFKGEETLPVIYVHRQSAYLIGRDRKIADFPIDHPSASKQHAVLQYRSLPFERADGSRGRRTRPYIIDLGSGNGTFLNGDRIESQRYYELKEKDVLRFGFSSREYVMLNEQSVDAGDETDTSADEDQMDDIVDRTGGEERLADEDDLF